MRERHRSREFVELPGALDAKRPEGHVMRLVPGDHPVRRPGEARAWLEGHPGRSGMVPAPTHGSWLNVIEGFFGKMARQMLRHIRVGSLDEPGGASSRASRRPTPGPYPTGGRGGSGSARQRRRG